MNILFRSYFLAICTFHYYSLNTIDIVYYIFLLLFYYYIILLLYYDYLIF